MKMKRAIIKKNKRKRKIFGKYKKNELYYSFIGNLLKMIILCFLFIFIFKNNIKHIKHIKHIKRSNNNESEEIEINNNIIHLNISSLNYTEFNVISSNIKRKKNKNGFE